MNTEVCDVLIVGAGPAGLVSAIELLQSGIGRVMLLEKGKSLEQRHCNALATGKCNNCRMCAVLSGVGGASGILGGQLCFFPAGERLARHTGYSTTEANQLLLSFFKRSGLTSTLGLSNLAIPEGNPKSIGKLVFKDYHAHAFLRPVLQTFFLKLIKNVQSMGGVIKTNAEMIDITPGKCENRFNIIYNHCGERKTVTAEKTVVLATGRSGVQSLSCLFSNLGINKRTDTVDVGVRLEVPSERVADLPLNLQDPKFKIYENTPDEVRTLCWCRGGRLSTANAGGVCLVDGHYAEEWYPLTSVSIVSRNPVAEGCFPLNHAIEQFGYIASLGAPAHQNLKEFIGIHSSKWGGSAKGTKSHIRLASQEVNLRSAITKPIITGIIEMLEELNYLVGGRLLDSHDAQVYAPVIDKFWERPTLEADLMTAIPSLYVVGDATDLGRGIIQGLFSGIVAAKSIIQSELEARLIRSNNEAVLLEVG